MGDVVRLLEESRRPVKAHTVRRMVRGGNFEVDSALRMLSAAGVVRHVPRKGYALARRTSSTTVEG